MQLGAMLLGKAHIGEYVMPVFVHAGGELGHLGADLIGDGAPLLACRLRRLLGKGGGDEGRYDPAALCAGMAQHVAHEVHPAAFPGSVEHFRDRRLDGLVSVGDDRLDAS